MKRRISKLFAIVGMLVLIFSLAACTKDENKETEVAGESTTEQEETTEKEEEKSEEKEESEEFKHENRVVNVALGGAASTSNPFAHGNVIDRTWLNNVFEPLFCYNGLTGEREPRVGKSVEISDDELTYTVEIFDNIYFQNGKHCTAEDVARSYEFAKTHAHNMQYSTIVDRVDVVDDYTVNIVLSEPSSPFLSNSDQIFIVDMDEVEEQGEEFGTIANKAGTGAYYIEKYDPAVEMILAYHDKFHRPLPEDKRPIPGINFKVMTDPSAVQIALEAGDVDFIAVQPSNYEDLKASGEFNVYAAETTQTIYYLVNRQAGAPFDNKKLRQAIAYACDYESMVDAGLEGLGVITGKLTNPRYTIAQPSPDETPTYHYDPEKAKELLAEAGFPDGVDLGKLTVISGGTHEKIAQVMQINLADVGMTIQLDPMEQVTTISDMRDGKYSIGIMGSYHMMDYDYSTNSWDIDGKPNAMTKMEGATQAGDFDGDKVRNLVKEARLYTDEEKRREIYTEMENIFMDAAVSVPICHTVLPYAWDKDLFIDTGKPYGYQFTHMWNCYWE